MDIKIKRQPSKIIIVKITQVYITVIQYKYLNTVIRILQFILKLILLVNTIIKITSCVYFI